MPRVGGEGVGGGDADDGIINKNNNNSSSSNSSNIIANDQQNSSPLRRQTGNLGNWLLGGRARSISGSGSVPGSGGGYVVLGGTRYGLRLSQESIPPSWCDRSVHHQEDHLSQDESSRDASGGFPSQIRDSSKERLTDNEGLIARNCGEKISMELAVSVADCCCIGQRSRLPMPRNSSSHRSEVSVPPGIIVADSGGSGGLSSSSSQHQQHQQQQQQSPPLAARNESAQLPPNSNANNNCGPLQMGNERHNASHPRSTTSSVNCRASSVSGSSVSSSTAVRVSSFSPVSSVPRQIAQWTKHQTLKLQEPAVTAVDRLHRFRWSGSSGGGGGSGGNGGKKSSSGHRSEKAERLRELTEKLKGPAPIPPPRRPSRFQTSSPSSYSANAISTGHTENDDYEATRSLNLVDYPTNEIRGINRTNSEENASSLSGNGIKSVANLINDNRDDSRTIIGTSESVGEELNTSERVPSLTNDIIGETSASNDISQFSNTGGAYTSDKNIPNYIDDNLSVNKNNIDSLNETNNFDKCGDSSLKSVKHHEKDLSSLEDKIASANRACSMESRDALARLEPRGPLLNYHRTGLPFRSASFSHADLNQARDRQRVEPVASVNRGTSVDGTKQVRASTLPRRRGDPGCGGELGSVITTPHNSPRASTPSLDSAVGSAEGLGIVLQSLHRETRPRSDGSDSLATSSALTSPEPPSSVRTEINISSTPPPPPPVPPPPPPLPQTVQSSTPSTNTHQQVDPLRETSLQTESIDNVPQRGTDDICSNSPRESWLESHEVIITPPEEPRLSRASEGSEITSETPSPEALSPSGKIRRSRGDNSKRRKGVYITQWPEPSEKERSKLAAQSSEEREDPSIAWSDLSDCEAGHAPRRYSKRPLRGPYGQMLEAEMAKPRTTPDIALEESLLRPRRKISANLSYTSDTLTGNSELPTPCHHRTTSSPSKLESLPGPSPELLAELLRGSSERVARATPQPHRNDTRNHVVVELYDTERSYVEALQILVTKYLQPLKSPENAGLIDAATVNEIFYQVPAILGHHRIFLEELRKRLESWELHQTIGDIFLQVFTKPNVLETYTLFLDNWKSAEKAIKTTCQAKPGFARFLETLEREHRGKLGLDQLLIKPVQKIPRYELLIQRLLKHTDVSHPDHDLLTAAQKEIHRLVVKINCTEREILEWEQQQSVLREVESLVEGLAGIVTKDRLFIRHDLVTIVSNQGTRKERALFLFSDLLVITNIKRRSGTIRKPSSTTSPNSLVGLPEANKYKMLMRISLDDVEMIKAKEESLRRMAKQVQHLKEDRSTLNQLQELAATLHGTKHQLEELIKEYLGQVQRQLAEKNAAHSQLACLELTLNNQNGTENITIMFTKPETRTLWEESFNDVKQKLAMSVDRRSPPEFVGPLPIRKTRAGLQFTCAAPTISTGEISRDVWVCNSDGYVGQICVLSLISEPPHVESCNGVCNARILCIAAIPAPHSGYALKSHVSSINNNSNNNTQSTPSTRYIIELILRDRYDRNHHHNQHRRRRCRSSSSSGGGFIADNRRQRRRRLQRQQTTLDNGPIDITKSGIGILIEDADANGQDDTLIDSSGSSEDSEENPDATGTGTATSRENLDGSSVRTFTSVTDVSSGATVTATGGEEILVDEDTLQPTVWLGTEDGCIHIYNCNDNIRIKKNRLKIQHGSSIHSIIYLDNKVFVSLANGDIAVYSCEYRYGWNTRNPVMITVGSPAAPVTKMIVISGNKLWCASHNNVIIVNTTSLDIEHSFPVSNDTTRAISSIAASGALGVWISLHNSAVLRLFHANSYECLTDINIAPAVTKMLASCDDIIRQHKAACLRVTALLSCNELLWVGTSAGVLLNIPIPHLKPSSQRLPHPPPVTGIPHGHTGHVRFLTCVEKHPSVLQRRPLVTLPDGKPDIYRKSKRHSGKLDKMSADQIEPPPPPPPPPPLPPPPRLASPPPSSAIKTGKILIISGGDGYEDFRGPQASVELQAGREDSTNHLLLWKV